MFEKANKVAELVSVSHGRKDFEMEGQLLY